MEKGQESKQKRKTPLTTIAISQEYAKKLDEYLNGTGITRKEFVELSVDYFQRTGFDLRGEAFDLSPLEKVAGRLEQSAKIMERHNEGTEAVHLLLQAVREQTAKQLPAPELIAHAAEEKEKVMPIIKSAIEQEKVIGAICNAASFMAKCGIDRETTSKTLQKSSVIQKISVTLSSVIIAIIVCKLLIFNTLRLQQFFANHHFSGTYISSNSR